MFYKGNLRLLMTAELVAVIIQAFLDNSTRVDHVRKG
jgi:hypothetical protein